MNKLILILSLVAFAVCGQTDEKKWNVGLHGGANQYSGEWGNDFYKFDQPYYGHVGVSVSRYLTRHFDAAFFATRGELGHFEQGVAGANSDRFLFKLNTYNLMARYHILGSAAKLSPYVFVGASVLTQRSVDNDVSSGQRAYDLALPNAGVGVNYRLGPLFSLQLQEMFLFTNADHMDFMTGGRNDWYLMHSLGVTFNIGKKSKNGKTAKGGVGDRIDRCSDVSRRRK